MELYECLAEEFRMLPLNEGGKEKEDLSVQDVALVLRKIRTKTRRVLSENEIRTTFRSFLAMRRARNLKREEV